jgi:NTP pyrophosphatase (non-canonical NTP hydrolase)
MEIEEYQRFTPTTAIYDENRGEEYILAGLIGEVGELYSAVAKYERGDFDQEELQNREIKELGDMMWFISQYCNMRGYNLGKVLRTNMDKLSKRAEIGTLRGDGDER